MLGSSSWIHKTAWSKTVQFFPDTASSKVWKRTIPLRNVQHHWNIREWQHAATHGTLVAPTDHLLQRIRGGNSKEQGPDPQISGTLFWWYGWGDLRPQDPQVSAGVTCHGGRSTSWANGSTKMWSFCEAHSMSIPCSCQIYTIMFVPCKNIISMPCLCHVNAI